MPNIPSLLILIGLAIFLVLALYWEAQDSKRLEARPHIYQIDDPVQREREYIFHACFNVDNNIQWRTIYIAAIVSALFIFYLLYYLKYPVSIPLFFMIVVIMVIVFYIVNIFRTFHLYRVMCSKVKPDLTVI